MREKTLMWSFKLSRSEEQRWRRIRAYGPNGSHGGRLSDIIRLALNELFERQERESRLRLPGEQPSPLWEERFGPTSPAATSTASPVSDYVGGADQAAAELGPAADDDAEVKKTLPRKPGKSSEREGYTGGAKSDRTPRPDGRYADLTIPRAGDPHGRGFLDMMPDEIKKWARVNGFNDTWAQQVINRVSKERDKRQRTATRSKPNPGKPAPPANGQTKSAAKKPAQKKGKV